MRKNSKVIRIFTASLLACGLSGTAAVNAAISGDINGDGKFNSSDIRVFSDYMTGKKVSSFDTSQCDFDKDGSVTISDYIMAKSTLLEEPAVETETNIHLNGNSITSEGDIRPSINGNKVTITSSGTYYVDGKLSGGQIIVDIPDEKTDAGTVKLVFSGVEITGGNKAPVYIANAEKTSITLESGTVNILRDGQNFTETEAVIFAKDDLTIKGDGRLEIYADTYYGIHCNNDLKINGADLYVETVTEDAVRGKSSVSIKDGSIFIDSAGDGIKSTKGNVDISGGNILIKAKSDAVQAETTLNISGGDISACGDKGLTALESVNITGGSVLATACDEQCQTISDLSSGTMLLNFTKEWKKNNPIALLGTSGNTVFEKNTLKKFSYALVSDKKLSGSYSVYTGGIEMEHSSGTSFTTGAPSAFDYINNRQNGTVLYGDLFDQSNVHSIKIDMPASEWNSLKQNAQAEEYHPADITIDGVTLKNVAIRAKGFSSLSSISSSGGEKFSLRINLDKYEKYQNYHGLTEFCINNFYGDPSAMRDILCYNAMHELDTYAPETAYTDVYMNGSLFSFYLLCEVPSDTMSERFSTDNDATLYKADEVTCTFETNQNLSGFSVKFGPDESMAHITEVANAVNKVTPDNYKFIEDIVDVPSFLKGFAVNAYMCNYDSYNGMMAHNYYLLWNNGKMSYVGWDYNLSLGAFMGGASSVNSDIKTALYNTNAAQRPLVAKLLAVTEYYNMYVDYVKQIASMYSDAQTTVNQKASLIRDHIKADPRYLFTAEQFESNIAVTPGGLQVSNDPGNTGGWGGFGDWGGFVWAAGDNNVMAPGDNNNWGGGGGFGNWGGGGFGDWGGGFGGGFGNGFGGADVSVTDFLIKRYEVVRNALGF